jgi:hypothetical protein
MNSKELIEKYKLGELNFDNQNLSGVDLSWEKLPGISLYGSDLYGAKLAGTVLTNANLAGGVNLAHADLGRADLTGANLRGADLRGANLRDAILTDAVYDEATHFPKGFNLEASGAARVEQTKPTDRSEPQTALPQPQATGDLRSIEPTQIRSDTMVSESSPTQVSTSAPNSVTSTKVNAASNPATPVTTNTPPAVVTSPNYTSGIIIGTALGVGLGILGVMAIVIPSLRTPLPQSQQIPQDSNPQPNPNNSASEESSQTSRLDRTQPEVPPYSPPFSAQPSPQAFRPIQPAPTCGSPPRSGTWWPVRGASSALAAAQQVCGDSYITVSKQTQVASFNNRGEAEDFASRLSQQTGQRFWVGDPTQR